MYICVDFDGTVVDHRFPAIGQPVPHAIHWLRRWQACGAKIVLFTMRSDDHRYGDVLTQAVRFLKDNGIVLYGVNRNPTQDRWTSSPKAFGHIYIDDAAYGCPRIQPEGFARPCVDWSLVGPAVERMLQQQVDAA